VGTSKKEVDMKPIIAAPQRHDFHDSSLLNLVISPTLDVLELILSTPNEVGEAENWLVRFVGLLKFDFETLGIGVGGQFPIEIYDIYIDEESRELKKWKERLIALALDKNEVKKVAHVVLASSFYRGWEANDTKEGIEIICRSWEIERAPSEYDKLKYIRPYIEAGKE
jgi:hypothetical protein